MLGFHCSISVGLVLLLPSYLTAFEPMTDGNWSEWSNFTDCSKSCDEGTQTRWRNCTNPAPVYGGADCCGQSQEVQSCNPQPCPEPTATGNAEEEECEDECEDESEEECTDTTTPVPNLPQECNNDTSRLDIQFLLDASRSVGKNNFPKVKQFVKRFAQSFEIGPDGVNIGVVTFNRETYNQFWLNEYTDKSPLLIAIDRIPETLRGGTKTFRGLEFVRTQAFSKEHGNRDDAADILIVVTDGMSVNKEKTLKEADILGRTTINTMVVGVGKNLDKDELQRIASEPSKVFYVSNFDSLDEIIERLQGIACKTTSDNYTVD